MKSYQEMIQWHVNQVYSGHLRHHEWPSYYAIAEAYEYPVDQVVIDINQEKEFRREQNRKNRKAENQVSNNQRRIANLVSKNLTTNQ